MSEPVAWRCFHCDETFTAKKDARLHFGREDGAVPACQIKGSEGGLVEAIRRAEEDAAAAWSAIHDEATEAARAYSAQSERHRQQIAAVEQVGYERGLADAKAHPETLGLVSADVISIVHAGLDNTEILAAEDGRPEGWAVGWRMALEGVMMALPPAARRAGRPA